MCFKDIPCQERKLDKRHSTAVFHLELATTRITLLSGQDLDKCIYNIVPLCVHISINNQWIVWYVELIALIQVSDLYWLRELKIKNQLYHQVQVSHSIVFVFFLNQ